MALTENLDQFFDTDDFAVDAVITLTNSSTVAVKVIFNTPSQSVQIYNTDIEFDKPFCEIKTSDLNGVKRGNAILINSVNYKIEKIVDDGTGVSTLYLK